MYISHFTDICIRKDRLHSIGWKSNFFSIFLFRSSRAQSYYNPAVRRNARKSYIYTYNRQHSCQSAFSQGASLVHFSFTYSQSKTLWSLHPSRHLAERKGAKRPQRCKAKAKCSQWAVEDEVDGAPWAAGWRGPARTGVCWVCKCLWFNGSCPSWNRAGDNWVMPLQNLNVDWCRPCPSLLSGSGWQEWWRSCPLTLEAGGKKDVVHVFG